MSYNIEGFVRFLGNSLDHTQRTNIMYFIEGHQRSVGIQSEGDIEAAERFVKLNDGRRQLYCNLNSCTTTCSGKPKDSDIPEVKNLYVDIDAVKAPGMKKHPATDEELDTIPINEIMDYVRSVTDMFYKDSSGNGYRIIIPVQDATQIDQRNLTCLLHSKFPDYIDTNVVDQSRITGVPGTMNVKEEILGRPNRRRSPFPTGVERMVTCVPVYSEDHRAIIDSMVKKSKVKKDHRTRTTTDTKELIVDDTQRYLNKYLLELSKRAPHMLRLIEEGPTKLNGFNWDGVIAADVYSKVGNAPRVFATIAHVKWGEDYSGEVTQKAWNDVINNNIHPWSINTFKRVFGVSYFEANNK